MFSSNFIFTVAFRYLMAKKNEKFVSIITAFSFLGIMIGVAALIVVMSVMKGFHREFSKNIIGLNGDINITHFTKRIDNYEDLNLKLLTKDYIKSIVPNVFGQALAIGRNTNNGVIIRGLDLEALKIKGNILHKINGGSFEHFHGKNVIAIGSELAYSLGLSVGDKIKLISPNLISTAFGSIPRAKEFNIIAVFTSEMYDYDSMTILMPVEAALNFLSIPFFNMIEIYTNSSEKVDIFTEDLQKLLGPEYQIISWKKNNMQFLKALEIERMAMFTILSLIIIVAAFNIISSLFMLVNDKLKDIAILKTIGASMRQIMFIFICHGLVIGLIGTILGILLGVGFASNIENIRIFLEQITSTKIFDAAIYFLYTLPSDVRIEDVGLVSILSITLSFLATIYPAYKASKLNPVEILRYE